MRLICPFNHDWQFAPADACDEQFSIVTLPHTNKLFTRLSVDNADYQFVSTYRKRFTLPESATGKRIFLDFDGAMLVSTVYINGALIGTHKGGFTPFSFDITAFVTAGNNVVTVYVDATEDKSVPPYGGQVDYLTFGGLYREITLRIVDPCHVVSVFPRPLNVLTAPGLEADIRLAQWHRDVRAEVMLTDGAGQVIAVHEQAVPADAFTVTFPALTGIALWLLDQPELYTLTVTLKQGGELLDQVMTRFGFRHAEFCDDGKFYLNGEPLKLFGLNRHQTYPYIGAAAPQRLQALDADILKHELGCNIVRTSHYAQSPHFLNRCDEIGLLVFEELAGWQHIGDAMWKQLALDDLQAMIERDRHHPSIILWGVRINESPDDDDFYQHTNALARALDPTRQTGGVRTFLQSHFLEDVFTLNDFPPGLQTPRVRPHLVTEFVGHMFPTKTWDHEERRIEHALHHARKHSLQFGHADVAGAIGWCAFDYHTHKEFGSGDRICYHGVMDMYRLPKMAAYFYRSQKAPTDEIVLYAATNWTMGDRNGGGNNPLVVFSNCDEIEVWIGEEYQGRFRPDVDHYPHLPHPPFTVRWSEPYNPWGTPFHDLTVRGYLNGTVAAEQKIHAAHVPAALRVLTHTDHLRADGADMARIAVQVIDKYGNVLPYQTRVVRFTLEGDADLIAANPLVLLGGQGACFVRSRRTSSQVVVHVETDDLAPVDVVLQISE
ncbi:MAG: glycoside hydrolase family 2 protein [Anaerolinea sp.]|nr:glycoside hydrolase family 2 protein [Anaerolinea sp.]